MYIVLSLYTIPLLLHPTRSGKKALELINLDTLLHQLHFFSPRLIGTVKAAWLGLCRQSGSSFYSVHYILQYLGTVHVCCICITGALPLTVLSFLLKQKKVQCVQNMIYGSVEALERWYKKVDSKVCLCHYRCYTL